MKTAIGSSTLYTGDSLAVLRTLPAESVRCVVTSPPFWGLRDYGMAEQLGLERTPDEYSSSLVLVFREVRRVLADDGTLWLNLGDSYNAYNAAAGPGGWPDQERRDNARPKLESGFGLRFKGLKPKDLVGIPWRVAFALQADGWFLRQDIIWSKPNPMPESVTDRCTKAHEYIFLLSKSRRYYFNADAIAEPCEESNDARPRMGQGPNTEYKQKRSGNKARVPASERGVPVLVNGSTAGAVASGVPWQGDTRNKRSVWTVPTKPFKDAHFATFPPKLVEPCILAGSEKGDIVLDPFAGTATVGDLCEFWGRSFIGIELNPKYVKIAAARLRKGREMFLAGDAQ